jgi:hypothetical protein
MNAARIDKDKVLVETISRIESEIAGAGANGTTLWDI